MTDESTAENYKKPEDHPSINPLWNTHTTKGGTKN